MHYGAAGRQWLILNGLSTRRPASVQRTGRNPCGPVESEPRANPAEAQTSKPKQLRSANQHRLWQIVYPSRRQTARRFGFGLKALEHSGIQRGAPCEVAWDIVGDFCDGHLARPLEHQGRFFRYKRMIPLV